MVAEGFAWDACHVVFSSRVFLLDPLLFEGLKDGSSDPAWHVIEVGRLSASGGGSGDRGAFTDARVEFSFGVIAIPCAPSVVPPTNNQLKPKSAIKAHNHQGPPGAKKKRGRKKGGKHVPKAHA